jgi:hypothetical protein
VTISCQCRRDSLPEDDDHRAGFRHSFYSKSARSLLSGRATNSLSSCTETRPAEAQTIHGVITTLS